MRSLEEQIGDIERLDELRQHAIGLRNDAIDALTAAPYHPLPRPGSRREADPPTADRDGWEASGDDIEKALVLRALSKREGRPSNTRRATCNNILTDLLELSREDCERVEEQWLEERERTGPHRGRVRRQLAVDSVPIFRSARILLALAETHGQALSNAAIFCLVRITREFYQIVPPTWIAGAARASNRALASAFVTGECARALLALEQALRSTAKAAGLLEDEITRASQFQSDFAVWKEHEDRFRAKSLHVSLTEVCWNLAVELPQNMRDAILERPATGRTYVEMLSKMIVSLMINLSEVLPRLPRFAVPPADANLGIAEGHLVTVSQKIAVQAVNDILAIVNFAQVKTLRRAVAVDADAAHQDLVNRVTRNPKRYSRAIASSLRKAADKVHALLEAAKQFATSMVDRELAIGSGRDGGTIDGAELVFAATLLGLLSRWDNPNVRSAFDRLRPLVTPDGRLLSIRPFHILGKGYRLSVAPFEPTRRLADLVAHLEVEVEPEFVEQLMRPLHDTRASIRVGSTGWTTDPRGREAKSVWWATALAVEALESIIDMLDAAINRLVLQNFLVRRPAELSLDLNALFYPDIGLAKRTGQHSVAMKLQGLRAHAGYAPPQSPAQFSLILYGPPGTGKSTLAEAVAKTADVPLVEITPSDILVGGAEEVERRARHVFRALSKLSHAVILFDEFDPILQDRAKRKPDEMPKTVFEFLTPGILPKLKTLHDAAKKQRVSYLLATNFVYDLDPAVTRQGRFDDRHGIYPPDVASRLGRLLDQLKRNRPGAERDEQVCAAIVAVAKHTAGGAMDQIAQKGWYTWDSDSRAPLFGRILSVDRDLDLGGVEVRREAQFGRERMRNEVRRRVLAEQARAAGLTADEVEGLQRPPEHEHRYWEQWEMVDKWDEALARIEPRGPDWTALYDAVDRATRTSP